MLNIDQQAFKQFIGLFIVGLISYCLMNAANAYLVNALGQEAYGDFSLTISLIFSLTPIFSVGITTLTTKYLPIYMTKQSKTKMNVFMKWNIQTLKKSLVIISVIILTITIIRITQINNSIPCIIEKCHSYRHFIGDLQFIVPVALLLIWNSSLLNATKHSFFANLLGSSNITYVCALIIFLAEIIFTSLNNNTILICLFISFLMLCCLQYLAIYFLILKPKKLSISEIQAPTIYPQTRQFFLNKGIGLLANSLSYIALGLISMLMIEWLSGNESVLGHYVIVLKIASLSLIPISALNFVITPYLSGLNDKIRVKKLQDLINFNHLVNLAWLIICLSAFFSFKPIIFKAYDINFQYATFSITLYLIFNYVFFGIFIKAQNICLFNDQNKKLYAVSAFQVIFLVILNLILVPRFSYVGAIYSNIASEIACGVICWLVMRSSNIKIKIFGFI